MTQKKPCYIADVFKKGTIIPALLIGCVIFSMFAAMHKFGMAGKVFNNSTLLTFVLCAIGFAFVVGVIYLLASVKCKKLTVADAIYLGLVIAAIAYAIFVAIYFKSFNIRRIIVPAVLFVVGVALMIPRGKYYTGCTKTGEITYTRNTLVAYYTTICSKFSFVGIAVCAAVCISLGYILFSPLFDIKTTIGQLWAAIILLLPIVIWVAVNLTKRSVGVIDAFLFSGLLSLPVILAQLLITKKVNVTFVCIWLALLAIYMLVLICRLLSFDLTKPSIEKKPKCNCYFNKLIAKFDWSLILAVGCALGFASLFFFDPATIVSIIRLGRGSIAVSLKSIPFFTVTFVALGAIGFAILFAALGASNKKINGGDFCLAFLTVFAVVLALSMIVHYSTILLNCTIALVAVVALLLPIRISVYKALNK